jgi:hypothetical protein
MSSKGFFLRLDCDLLLVPVPPTLAILDESVEETNGRHVSLDADGFVDRVNILETG